jgi:esterase/lipase superfamily enzyme
VILASPDIDVNVFYHQFLDLGASRPAFTIFVSRDDNALRLSRLLGGNVDRVGAIDLSKEPYRSGIEHTGIRIIDLSRVRGVDGSNHLKFSESPDIVNLLGNSLIDGQPLSDSAMSLYDKMGVLIIGGSRIGVEKTDSAIGRKP